MTTEKRNFDQEAAAWDENPVRVFSTFTEDLEAMARWLVSCGITTVAMESKGVYWIPPYDVLEQHGIKACLVDARGMKNVPGRRTDWHECQWIQFLHSVGLLRAAFRPDGDVCAVRSLMRCLVTEWGQSPGSRPEGA